MKSEKERILIIEVPYKITKEYFDKIKVGKQTKKCSKKPDCYECIYKRNIPGSTHIACHHPAFKDVHDNLMLEILGIFAGVGRILPIPIKVKEIKVVGNLHGIRKGWFNHPLNFDPTWLDECNGFKKRGLKIE